MMYRFFTFFSLASTLLTPIESCFAMDQMDEEPAPIAVAPQQTELINEDDAELISQCYDLFLSLQDFSDPYTKIPAMYNVLENLDMYIPECVPETQKTLKAIYDSTLLLLGSKRSEIISDFNLRLAKIQNIDDLPVKMRELCNLHDTLKAHFHLFANYGGDQKFNDFQKKIGMELQKAKVERDIIFCNFMTKSLAVIENEQDWLKRSQSASELLKDIERHKPSVEGRTQGLIKIIKGRTLCILGESLIEANMETLSPWDLHFENITKGIMAFKESFPYQSAETILGVKFTYQAALEKLFKFYSHTLSTTKPAPETYLDIALKSIEIIKETKNPSLKIPSNMRVHVLEICKTIEGNFHEACHVVNPIKTLKTNARIMEKAVTFFLDSFWTTHCVAKENFPINNRKIKTNRKNRSSLKNNENILLLQNDEKLKIFISGLYCKVAYSTGKVILELSSTSQEEAQNFQDCAFNAYKTHLYKESCDPTKEKEFIFAKLEESIGNKIPLQEFNAGKKREKGKVIAEKIRAQKAKQEEEALRLQAKQEEVKRFEQEKREALARLNTAQEKAADRIKEAKAAEDAFALQIMRQAEERRKQEELDEEARLEQQKRDDKTLSRQKKQAEAAAYLKQAGLNPEVSAAPHSSSTQDSSDEKDPGQPKIVVSSKERELFLCLSGDDHNRKNRSINKVVNLCHKHLGFGLRDSDGSHWLLVPPNGARPVRFLYKWGKEIPDYFFDEMKIIFETMDLNKDNVVAKDELTNNTFTSS